jgi:hypothetical protein
MTEGACENTDRELWRERFGDFYADSIHVTKDGGIGINVSGHVIVMPLQKWHSLAAEPAPESAVQSETVRRNMLNSGHFASLFGTFGRLSQRELHIMNAALTLVADQPAPEPVAWRWSESGEKRWFPWTTEWDLEKRAQELGCPIQYAYAHPPKAEPAPTTQVPVAWHKMARVWIGGDVFEDRWVACSEDSAGAEPLYAQSTQSAKEKT